MSPDPDLRMPPAPAIVPEIRIDDVCPALNVVVPPDVWVSDEPTLTKTPSAAVTVAVAGRRIVPPESEYPSTPKVRPPAETVPPIVTTPDVPANTAVADVASVPTVVPSTVVAKVALVAVHVPEPPMPPPGVGSQ